jgi:hypothetical protein
MRWLSALGACLALATLFAFAMPQVAAAQDATPTGDLSPNPEECTVAPRPLEELQALFGTPFPEHAGEATTAAREATAVPFELPAGTPADAATVRAITAVVRQLTACYNAGDYLAGFSLATDDFIRLQVGLALFDEDLVAAMKASPVPLSEEQQTKLLGVRRVVVLSDGRVAALVDYSSPTPQPAGIRGVETDLFIFEKVGGAWLLDESVENLEAQYGPEGVATPTT